MIFVTTEIGIEAARPDLCVRAKGPSLLADVEVQRLEILVFIFRQAQHACVVV